jgi:hypothetical protein
MSITTSSSKSDKSRRPSKYWAIRRKPYCDLKADRHRVSNNSPVPIQTQCSYLPLQPVFENLVETKKLEANESVAFYKIQKKNQRNLEKFSRNAFDERKEQEFFENMKIG